MNNTSTNAKANGKKPEDPQAMKAPGPTQTTKPPPATPLKPPKWDLLIPRMSPLLGPQYQTREQANPILDEATQSKRGEEDTKRIQAMIFKQHIPQTAHDINLALHANQQIPPENRIHPPQQGSKEFKYIHETTIPWSEKRKCELMNIIPSTPADVIYRPTCSQETKFLERHVKKQSHLHYFRTTPGTDGIHPERTFNGLLSEEEWKQSTVRDLHGWKVVPPYTISNGLGKRMELSRSDACRAQFRGYNDEFKTGNTGMFRRHFFPGAHHVEDFGGEEMAVIQGQGFKIWREGEEMGEGGDGFEMDGSSRGEGEWVSSNVGNEDTFERFMGGVEFEGERFVHSSFQRYPGRDVEMEKRDVERLRRYEYQGM